MIGKAYTSRGVKVVGKKFNAEGVLLDVVVAPFLALRARLRQGVLGRISSSTHGNL